MMKILCAVVTAILAMATPAGAQNTSPATSRGGISFAATYNADDSGVISGSNNFWMQGGSVELSGTAYKSLGVVAKVIGLHTGNIGEGIPLSLVTATFGPRYTWTRRANRHSLAIFGQGLVGEANGFRSYFPEPGAAISSSNSLAVQAGGGVDLGLSRHIALRMIEASWLRTQLPNATTSVQNNFVLGAGVVLRFGKNIGQAKGH
jgi:outer membrane immunogenic protein